MTGDRPATDEKWWLAAGARRLLCASLAVAETPDRTAALRRVFTGGDVNWLMLVAVANQSLLSPALYDALAARGLLDAVPEVVAAYLGALRRENGVRNRVLRTQAMEAVTVFNRAGIEPVLLDATAPLLEAGGENGADAAGDRILTHVDLLVTATEETAAKAALRGLGYRAVEGAAPPSGGIDDYRRPDEVGTLSLHRSVVSFSMRDDSVGGGGLLSPDEVCRDARPRVRDGLVYRVPRLEHRVLHRVLHDQVQEYGHYLGRLSLRHLYDLARLLVVGGRTLDGAALAARMARHGLRPALVSHLLAAHDLFAAPLPTGIESGPWLRLHHRRRLLQWRSPVLAAASELGGAVAWTLARCRYAPLPPGWRGEALLLGLRARHLVGLVCRDPRRAFATPASRRA